MAKPEDESKPEKKGKPEGGKPEGEKKQKQPKAEGGKPEGGKAEGGKPEGAEGGEKKQKQQQPKGDKGGKGGKKPEGGEGGEKKEKKPTEPPPPVRLYIYYKDVVRPAMKKAFNYPNDNAVPKLVKIVLNMGVGKARENPKMLEALATDMGAIAGQKPQITKAKTSIANFKLRQGMAIGCKVTLRRNRMYEFLDRLLTVAVPRIRDFRGLSPKQFDGRGNYSMGVTEQIVFPEIQSDKVEFFNGMNIVVCTTAQTDKEALELLRLMGFPFRGLDVAGLSLAGAK
jgi:large subunit ribosomal protein L5